MAAYLADLAATRPEVRVRSIGKSAQGRDIWVVELGKPEPTAPTIVCAQTPQPSEMGHHACRAILDPSRPAPLPASRLRDEHGSTTMTIHDHIAELRAELAGCVLTRAERKEIEAEIARALAQAASTEPRRPARGPPKPPRV